MSTRFADCPSCGDPALAAAGWRLLRLDDGTVGFDAVLGDLLIRAGDDGSAQAWTETGPARCNFQGRLHGGFLAAFAEKCLHLPLYLNDRIARGGVVVIDLVMNYLATGNPERPVISHTWLLRETGRMGFVRGELRQDDTAIAGYTGIVRKLNVGG